MAVTKYYPLLATALIDESAPNAVQGQTPKIPYGGTMGSRKRLLVKYNVEDGDTIFNSILVSAEIRGVYKGYGYQHISVSVLAGDFDPATVTWNTRPATASWSNFDFPLPDNNSVIIPIDAAASNWGRIQNCAVYGFEFSYSEDITNTPSVNNSYLYIGYETLGAYISNLSPSNGAFVHKSKSNTFSWAVETNALENNPPKSYWPTQTSATFQWRASESSTTNSIPAGTGSNVTVPAGTFSTASIQWRVVAALSDGSNITTDWVTCTTVDALSTAVIVMPKNTILDGSTENVFRWEHSISTGTEQTAFDLQTSPDNKTWTTILNESTAAASAVVPENTLPGGNIYWRVRTYNADGVAGAWSDAAAVVVIAAPSAPGVTVVDNSPRFSVRWQQSGQQAYELQLDGSIVTRRFGAESFYKHEGYIASGSHTVRVRIQNQYGLWSDWGSAALSITNTEGAAITLAVTSGVTTRLSWSTDDAYSKYLVYRNGTLIGESSLRQYTDHFALGEANYQVRGVYEATGYYTLSNVVAAYVDVPCIMIAPVDNPLWQKLKFSTASLRKTNVSASRAVTYQHYTGVSLPSAEVGEAVSMAYGLDCAFRSSDLSAAAAFEALLGKLVCVKEPTGERYVGILDSFSKENVGKMYRRYNASITLVDWEEAAT